MNRKDAILVAVLLNAGLLIVLFAFSMNSEDVQKINPQNSSVVTAVTLKEAPPQQIIPATPARVEPVKIVEVSKNDFVAELKKASEIEVRKEPETVATSPVFLQEALKEVIVKKGDVLDKIAKAHGCKVEEIVKVNNLKSTNLSINQVLKIPQKSNLANKALKPSATFDGDSKYYIVKPGDNPWTIALKNQMKVEELLEINGLDADKARHLKPGDQLKIK